MPVVYLFGYNKDEWKKGDRQRLYQTKNGVFATGRRQLSEVAQEINKYAYKKSNRKA